MRKIENTAILDLDNVALQHYNTLIGSKSTATNKYHTSQSLIGRIEKQKAEDAGNKIKVDFWDFILLNLQKIITGRPNILKSMIPEIEAICGAGYFSTHQTYDNAQLTPFGKVVKKIFNYELYRSKPECKNYFEKLKISLCPYCNEGIVQVIVQTDKLNNDQKKIALLQLDHFYPRARHPYFSVSFFNLIPGCSPCNAQLKGDKNFDINTHFNPFEKDFNSYFRFKLDTLMPLSDYDISFSYENILTYPDDSLIDFRIIDRYRNASHKREIFNLYNTLKNYSPNVRRSLSKQFTGLFTTESKIKLLLKNSNVPTDVNDINIVPIGKLKRDIAIQLGFLID